jgi:hypothetical protein
MKILELITPLTEDATAGSTGSASVSAVIKPLGEKDSTKALIKRQKSYTNQQTVGGKVKVKK